jgi:hypothetical protein
MLNLSGKTGISDQTILFWESLSGHGRLTTHPSFDTVLSLKVKRIQEIILCHWKITKWIWISLNALRMVESRYGGKRNENGINN